MLGDMRTQLTVFTIPLTEPRLWGWVPTMHQSSSASVSLPASPGDTLEVSHTLVLPHSIPDKTCRCRPGKRANAWPRAREPLPACWDLRKVCVSNPGSARWGRRGCWEGCRQGHAAQGLGRGGPQHQGPRSWDPSPWALLSPKVFQLLGRGLPGRREREHGGMWAFLGDATVGRKRRQKLEGSGAGEHPWGSLGPVSLLDSSIQKGQSLPIKLGSHQPTGQPAPHSRPLVSGQQPGPAVERP